MGVSMADKTFDSRIKVRYGYSDGKVGNTVYKPYAFDSGDGGQYTFSDTFENTIPIYHSGYDVDDGKGYFFGTHAKIKSLEQTSKIPKPFLCFRSTNGANSLFSSIDKTVIDKAGTRAKNGLSGLGGFAVSGSSLLFKRHGIIPDKGTIKFKAGNSDTVYTAEGLRSVDKSYNNVDAITNFTPYGTCVTGKNRFNATSYTFPLYTKDIYANDGYSNMMLIVFAQYTIRNSVDLDSYSVYSFVPISFYDLSILNNRAPSSKWSIKVSTTMNTDESYNEGTLSIICEGTSSGLDVNIFGRNYYNLSRGLLKPEANNVFDFNWRAPNDEGGTPGSMIPEGVYRKFYDEGRGAQQINSYGVYSFFISEMSYKYYMYGEGRSLWVENANKSVDVNNLNSVEDKIKADFRVKWYPFSTTISRNREYFKDKPYLL